MDVPYVILVVLHITSAALAFGATIGGTGAIRRAMPLGHAAMLSAAREDSRRGGFATVGALLTLAFGLALIFYRGGFKVVTPNYHAALGFMVIELGVIFVMLKPAGQKLVAYLEANKTPDTGVVSGHIKKIAMWSGITHLLWLIMLYLMFARMGTS